METRITLQQLQQAIGPFFDNLFHRWTPLLVVFQPLWSHWLDDHCLGVWGRIENLERWSEGVSELTLRSEEDAMSIQNYLAKLKEDVSVSQWFEPHTHRTANVLVLLLLNLLPPNLLVGYIRRCAQLKPPTPRMPPPHLKTQPNCNSDSNPRASPKHSTQVRCVCCTYMDAWIRVHARVCVICVLCMLIMIVHVYVDICLFFSLIVDKIFFLCVLPRRYSTSRHPHCAWRPERSKST